MFIGRMKIKTELKSRNRVKVLKYGDCNDVINPGDLILIFTANSESNGASNISEMSLYLQGKDMELIAKYVNTAKELYEVNKYWLNEPMTKEIIQTN